MVRFLCALLLATTSPLWADELRLADGRVLVGTVQERGELVVITSPTAQTTVARQDIVQHRRDSELRAELAAQARSAGDSAFAALQLARRARELGLLAELWRHLDHCQQQLDKTPAAERGPGHAATARLLAEFLPELGPELLASPARPAPPATVPNLLDLLRPGTGPGRTAAIVAALAQQPAPALQRAARSAGAARQRAAANQALLANHDRRDPAEQRQREQFVLRSALFDDSAELRRTATALLREAGAASEATVASLLPGLQHSDGQIRLRAAAVLGGLGHPAAIKPLVAAGPLAGAGLDAGDRGRRAHVAFVQQQAYVRDFDVEVAQGAAIANPRVDVLQTGVVLDATVIGVFEVRRLVQGYRQALMQLTGNDPGGDPKRWPLWLAERGVD